MNEYKIIEQSSCLEAEFHNGKIWIAQGDEFESSSGEQVVFLKDFSGYFCCKFLQVVNDE